MANNARAKLGASLIVLSLTLSSAAFSAGENAVPDKPAGQAQPDDRSYLPPWMQGKGGGETANMPTGNGANGAASGQPSAAVDDDAAKKAKIASQTQKSRRHDWPGETLIGGFVGLFGR